MRKEERPSEVEVMGADKKEDYGREIWELK